MSQVKSNNNNEELTKVKLPYDFIPYPRKGYIAAYSILEEAKGVDALPRHNTVDKGNESGYIEYSIKPESDLAVELREDNKGNSFVSGSVFRGVVRSNMEILSASYPLFVDKSPLLYRDFTNSRYKTKLGIKEGIEKDIEVGFLKKVGTKFSVIPAAQISSNKNFVSIKEHRLQKMGIVEKDVSLLFRWKESVLDTLGKLEKEIYSLTNQIKASLQEETKDNRGVIIEKVEKVFTHYFKFNKEATAVSKKRNLQAELFKLQKKIVEKLEELENNKILKASDLNEAEAEQHIENRLSLYKNYAKRWTLKVEVELEYRKMSRSSKNGGFKPYQKNVYYSTTENGGVKEVRISQFEEGSEKGYLFNSTNASSKRSHYLISKEDFEETEIALSDDVINGYRRNLKKFRDVNIKKNEKVRDEEDKIKDFYNIFDCYEELVKKHGALPIVFYKVGNKGIENIGRTPYFKVEYEKQLDELIGEDFEKQVDYTRALFGFINEGDNKKTEKGELITAYKSRLRFSPIRILKVNNNDEVDETGEVGIIKTKEVGNFVLLTPQPTAFAMYLEQKGNIVVTYNDKCRLRGNKYYHILKNVVKLTKAETGYTATRNIFELCGENRYIMKGRVYFKNLSKIEIGLLLLSTNIGELKKSEKFTDKYKDKLDKCYELIGGAKPYGYGKVKITCDSVNIEKQEHDEGSLLGETHKKELKYSTYIDAFIKAMNKETKEDYFNNIYFDCYLQSKLEDKESPNINWKNLEKKIMDSADKSKVGGYPKKWILESKEFCQPIEDVKTHRDK